MRFLKKLKYTLLFKLLNHNFFIPLICLVLFLLIIKSKSILLIILLTGYLIYIIKKSRLVTIFIICLFLITTVRMLFNNYFLQNEFKDSINTLKVINIKKLDSGYQVIFKKNFVKVISYTKDTYELGAIYEIKGNITKPFNSHFEGGFDYNEYLKNQNIVGILEIEAAVYKKKSVTINYLNYQVNNYLDSILKTNSKEMIKALTIGNKDDFDDLLYSNITKIGISHLFVISGLHISLIYQVISLFLNKIKLKENKNFLISLLFIFLFYIISGLMVSVLRVILSIVIKKINDKCEYHLSSIDVFSINAIIVLLLNPMQLFMYSFSLSYLICGGMIISSNILKSKNKNKILNFVISNFKVSLFATIITIPLVSKINPQINFLSSIYNIFYIPLVTYIFMPLSFIVMLFPILEPFYNILYHFFEILTNFLAGIKIFNINFPNVSYLIIILFYVFFYFILLNIERKKKIKKSLVLFIGLIIFWNNINLFNIYDEVYFLDLPVGEATFIRKSHNRSNILIDTGEDGFDDIIMFLKNLGIKRLDIIIITHADSDHMGMIEEITNNFKVKNVYYSLYDNYTKTKIKKGINHQSLKVSDVITLYDIKLKVISPSINNKNTNDNSLVLLGDIFKRKYLFTGDITKKIEMNLPKFEVDILKIPHHGSATSSSDNLFEKVDFNLAICMNGYKNQFSFPNPNIKEKYQNKILVTSITNTICIRKYKYANKFKIIFNN